MISRDEFEALGTTYEKHGWVLRRLVLRDVGETPVGLPNDVLVSKGVVDAVWFSRPPRPGHGAWEIRYLGPAQFALVEHLDESAPDFEQNLHQTEQRLADAVVAKRTA